MKIDNAEKVVDWLSSYSTRYNLHIEQIKFSDSKEWKFDEKVEQLHHRTNGFFSVRGLQFTSNFYNNKVYHQPIIYQPEIGILGFLAQIKNNELYLFAQAKTEPGNVNTVQLAPTLQATESNYKALHGGVVPEYLNYFLETDSYTILVDQLQSEQGSRFFKKRNRNMVVLLPSHVEIQDTIHHKWISITLWKELLTMNHLLNTDSRSVIASLLFSRNELLKNEFSNSPFSLSIQNSFDAENNSFQSLTSILDWIKKLKSYYTLETKLIPLSQLNEWVIDETEIKQLSGDYFSVIQYRVYCESREVIEWDQPLVNSNQIGFNGLICKNINGVLHLLLQAKVEPGNFDKIELTSTVHQSLCEYEIQDTQFIEMINDQSALILAVGMSSEEGGRFYKDENNYKIVLIDDHKEVVLPINYTWLSLHQVSTLIRFNNFFTNELRSLFALMSSKF